LMKLISASSKLSLRKNTNRKDVCPDSYRDELKLKKQNNA
jgi:hypothetical protein